jgi:hypothetical protein
MDDCGEDGVKGIDAAESRFRLRSNLFIGSAISAVMLFGIENHCDRQDRNQLFGYLIKELVGYSAHRQCRSLCTWHTAIKEKQMRGSLVTQILCVLLIYFHPYCLSRPSKIRDAWSRCLPLSVIINCGASM